MLVHTLFVKTKYRFQVTCIIFEHHWQQLMNFVQKLMNGCYFPLLDLFCEIITRYWAITGAKWLLDYADNWLCFFRLTSITHACHLSLNAGMDFYLKPIINYSWKLCKYFSIYRYFVLVIDITYWKHLIYTRRAEMQKKFKIS